MSEHRRNYAYMLMQKYPHMSHTYICLCVFIGIISVHLHIGHHGLLGQIWIMHMDSGWQRLPSLPSRTCHASTWVWRENHILDCDMKIIHHQSLKILYFIALMHFLPMFLRLSTHVTLVPISILLVQNRREKRLSQNFKYLQNGLVKRWIAMVSCRTALRSTSRSFIHSKISITYKVSKELILSRNSELKGPQYLRGIGFGHGGASCLVLQKTHTSGNRNLHEWKPNAFCENVRTGAKNGRLAIAGGIWYLSLKWQWNYE